jgi:hypothetical protein
MSNKQEENPRRARAGDGERCLKAALAYRKLDWSVLALCAPDHAGFGSWHKCASPGKRPWHRWAQMQHKRPTEAQVRQWWAEHGNSNVGVALGPVSGLVRIDVDGREAEAALRRLSRGDLPHTLKFTGGRPDSFGLLFAIPEGVELRTTPKPGGVEIGGELRLQAQGAQTVLPPSRHPNGRRYRWVSGCGPDDSDAAAMPGWLVELMRPGRPSVRPSASGKARRRVASDGPIPRGQRNGTLTSVAGRLRRRGSDEEAIAAVLLAANASRCSPPLDEDEVRAIARSVARYAPGVVVVTHDDDDIQVQVRRAKRPGHYVVTATLEVTP